MKRWTDLKNKVSTIVGHIEQAERLGSEVINNTHPERQSSVRNFIHYLALRQLDVRSLQLELAEMGLSSFGRSEGYVLGNIQATLNRINEAVAKNTPGEVHSLEDTQGNAVKKNSPCRDLSWRNSESLLHKNTRSIFGPKPEKRHVYIMVTAPDHRIADDHWLDCALNAGMNVLRINAVHEDLQGMALLITRARARALVLQKSLKILLDLPGPKIRTESLYPGTQIAKFKPVRNIIGQVVKPCYVEIQVQLSPLSESRTVNSLVASSPIIMEVGDTLTLEDMRGRPRTIRIIENRDDASYLGCLDRTTYVGPSTIFHIISSKGLHKGEFTCKGLPVVEWFASIPQDESLALVKPGWEEADAAKLEGVTKIAVTSDAILPALTEGRQVMIDDGKIATRVVTVNSHSVVLKIEKAIGGIAKIRGDMGLNLPGTDLLIPAVSESDRQILNFAKDQIDMLGVSFVRSADDVRAVESLLGDSHIGLMIKVETQSGFLALPEILLETLGRRDVAVMIARGDLAVECGFERLAEVQEEILWLCEAAHVPVVWATQVLETLAKRGIPTRAEITDAAMAVRAECVMLNKGPYIAEAARTLDSILRRMEDHQYKKRQLYRPLKLRMPKFMNASAGQNLATKADQANVHETLT